MIAERISLNSRAFFRAARALGQILDERSDGLSKPDVRSSRFSGFILDLNVGISLDLEVPRSPVDDGGFEFWDLGFAAEAASGFTWDLELGIWDLPKSRPRPLSLLHPRGHPL